MKISIQNRDDVKIVHVSGAVESHAAGEFFDALLDCVGDGTTKLIVDLSGVHIMARAAVRGLVVAAKLVEPDRGALRIASAPRSIEEFLQSLGFNHLLRCDQSVQASLARLQGGDGCEPSLPPRAAAVSAGR